MAGSGCSSCCYCSERERERERERDVLFILLGSV